MSDTTRSTLRHLLIHESMDTSGPCLIPGSMGSTSPSILSPSLSPMSTSPSPPNETVVPVSLPLPKTTGSRMLPPPRITIDRRASQSIFSLLNDLRVVSPSLSPLSLSPTTADFPTSPKSIRTPPLPRPRTPLSAPIPASYQSQYFPNEQRYPLSGPLLPRPDVFRRHSCHPYECNTTSQAQQRGLDSPPVHSYGSRTPISRTTKACNACRSRKVRCDAGGQEALATGQPSTCSRCREAGFHCVYSGLQKKRGPCPG